MLREFYLAIATLATHECFAFGCGSLFAYIRPGSKLPGPSKPLFFKCHCSRAAGMAA